MLFVDLVALIARWSPGISGSNPTVVFFSDVTGLL